MDPSKVSLMLFLLNDHIVELASPEARLLQRWRTMGCGDPRVLRAQEAIDFTADYVGALRNIDQDIVLDVAALIISKTGANNLTLKPTASGKLEPRLRDLPPMVLETYQRGAANDEAGRRLQTA